MFENEIIIKILLVLFLIGSVGAWLVGYIDNNTLVNIAIFVASYMAGNFTGYKYGLKKGYLKALGKYKGKKK
jgi:hypothetical protein